MHASCPVLREKGVQGQFIGGGSHTGVRGPHKAVHIHLLWEEELGCLQNVPGNYREGRNKLCKRSQPPK